MNAVDLGTGLFVVLTRVAKGEGVTVNRCPNS